MQEHKNRLTSDGCDRESRETEGLSGGSLHGAGGRSAGEVACAEEEHAQDECDLLPHAVGALPATDQSMQERLNAAQEKLNKWEQVEIKTDHVLHAGMYSRTVTLPPGTAIIGVLVKVPTLVITVGSGMVMVGDRWVQINGYHVITGSAMRKQAFVSDGALIVTMLFPTNARTVAEAEAAFTDETDSLLSHRQPYMNSVLIGDC